VFFSFFGEFLEFFQKPRYYKISKKEYYEKTRRCSRIHVCPADLRGSHAVFRLPEADMAELYKTTGKFHRGPAAFLLMGLMSLMVLAGCPMDVLEDFTALDANPIVDYDPFR
jgi:hypothetical protein